jgi:acyl-coenzyme A synthetase/AMP-(fatty) acid ligase
LLSVYLGASIAKIKIPRAFVFVETLPRTPYGKVLKDELRRRYLAGPAEETGR